MFGETTGTLNSIDKFEVQAHSGIARRMNQNVPVEKTGAGERRPVG
jgi:hypothetical protein